MATGTAASSPGKIEQHLLHGFTGLNVCEVIEHLPALCTALRMRSATASTATQRG